MSNQRATTMLVALYTLLLAGCPDSGPPQAPQAPPQPLVVGTTPPAPIVTSAPSGSSPPEEADGDAPHIKLGSLTTPGQVFVPAHHVVVVHFFATWCTPCQETMPRLQALFAEYRDRGLEVLAISVDDDETGVGDFARKLGVKFPVGWDAGHALVQLYKVDTMPMTFVIDRQGNIAKSFSGWQPSEQERIREEVETLL